MLRLKEFYQKEITAKMKEKFGYKNIFEAPRINKVVINVGIGKLKDDAKAKEVVISTIKAISGQKPAIKIAKKAISGFKLRQNDPVGVMVTLRGNRMYDFLEKLTRIVLPRTRDFRGLKLSSIDKQGNLNIGIKEQVIFAEVKSENLEKVHSLQVCISTTAKSGEEAMEFYKLLGFVFADIK